MASEGDNRALFCVPGPGPYLLTHSVGCASRAALEAMQRDFAEPWANSGGDAWTHWLNGIENFRVGLARLLGGAASEYCPQPNLSAALSCLLGALPAPAASRRVWIAAEDSFPSLGFVLHQARRLGFELRLITRDRLPTDPQTWSDALTPDVCGALVTHVHSNTGYVAPIRQIAQLCASRGVLSVIDVAQSAGILPLDLPELGADVVLGSCVKWLCGGPGAGFMWVRSSVMPGLKPIAVGWFSHAEPFEFDIHSYQPAEDARRFWGGTPSVAPFVTAVASLRIIHDLGVAKLLKHNRRLQQAFRSALPERWRDRLPDAPVGGTLCVPLAAQLPAITERLVQAGVRFDCRGTVLRLSFHLYNSVDDAVTTARVWPA